MHTSFFTGAFAADALESWLLLPPKKLLISGGILNSPPAKIHILQQCEQEKRYREAVAENPLEHGAGVATQLSKHVLSAGRRACLRRGVIH